MDEQLISNLYFDNYYIKNINFQLNTEFENDDEIELDIDINVSSSCSKTQNKGSTNITINVFKEAAKNNYPFELEANIIGYFSAEKEMSSDKFEKMCRYNGAAILFPFLRSAITDITKTVNISPLVLPLVNVQHFIDKEDKLKDQG